MEGNNQDNETKKNNSTETSAGVNENTDTTTEVNDSVVETISEVEIATPVAIEEDMVVLTNSESVKSSLPIKQYIIAAVVITIIGMALWYGLEKQGRVQTGVFDRISALVKPEASVAVVNGIKISKTQYEKSREQIIASASQQGLDMTDEKIKAEIDAQAIDVLINTELLKQVAEEAGVVVTPEQIETRYQEVIASVGGADELTKRMTELGITEAGLRSDIEGEILIQSYLADAVDTSGVTVEETDITTAYENAGGADAGLPALADVRDQIEAQLKSAKEQELITNFIKTLKDKATIEVLI
ncbi:hypothetical protein A2592_00110 [Candidatus Kaiserbacteria bacterium RIFOXYD1_FULL_42_15]|uniref:SurA N-terminal domain-containing protein n=1 Tax=Candidatus Kaiserbacteria bacterium RIFOXYD1_FULL_42_15 TaxID=1798532 RepID=A0A1F6FQW7_9BACT|nr:MAG: hypothetical protein A2592_00110 [Candidatus Kaiserbacteria bacterium RIFOXYD1_FULL_42_15]